MITAASSTTTLTFYQDIPIQGYEPADLRALLSFAAGPTAGDANDTFEVHSLVEAMALIGIGYRGLSMSPASIGPVKAAILAMHAGETAAFLDGLLADRSGAASLRDKLRAYADAKGVPL